MNNVSIPFCRLCVVAWVFSVSVNTLCGITDAELASMVSSGEIPGNTKKLALLGNQINDISPLQTLKDLETLDLDLNQISDITPLKSLTKLKKLNLIYNNISDLEPLSSLRQLKELDLTHNQISDITPLKSLTNLESLKLSMNSISQKQIGELQQALPNCWIDVGNK